MRKSILSLILLLIQLFSFAQEKYTTESKKAIKLFGKALDAYQNQNDMEAIKLLDKALKTDSLFIEAYLLKSDIYHTQKNKIGEINALSKVAEINPGYSPNTLFYLGRLSFEEAMYEKALSALEQCLDYNLEAKKKKQAKFYIRCCEFSIHAMENPVPFEPKNLGMQVNTEFNDLMPSLTIDEKTLITTVDIPIDERYPWSMNNKQEDFFISRKVNGQWTKSINMGPPVNTKGNEGAQSISADGKKLVFAACHRPDGFGSCDLYISSLTAKGWTVPKNMGPAINTGSWETQPSLTADGRALYFVSNRKGGQGRQDLWYSELDEQGNWKKAENLGPTINTPEDEGSPFIHPDNSHLYFSSKGHVNLGGFDLFRSVVEGNLKFSEPENMAYPINTNKDDEFLIINARGDEAYFSSERPDSRRKDVYSFKLYPEMRPDPVRYVQGTIIDAETHRPVKAGFELINLKNSKLVFQSTSSADDGSYLVCLPVGNDYAFNANAPGYLFRSEHFSLSQQDESSPEKYQLDIELWPIKPGRAVVLNNIFFETDRYNLKPESMAELEKLLEFLQNNPEIKIEIGGHTDNQGSKEHNQVLSENRARAVYDYLIEKNIDSKRLSYKGYGFAKAIATNATEEGRAQNRRTEFTILP